MGHHKWCNSFFFFFLPLLHFNWSSLHFNNKDLFRMLPYYICHLVKYWTVDFQWYSCGRGRPSTSCARGSLINSPSLLCFRTERPLLSPAAPLLCKSTTFPPPCLSPTVYQLVKLNTECFWLAQSPCSPARWLSPWQQAHLELLMEAVVLRALPGHTK